MFQHIVFVLSICFYAGTAITHTNQTAAFTELNAATNRRADAYLGSVDDCRCEIGGGVNGSAGTLGAVRYSADAGANFSVLATCPADSMTATIRAGTWQAVPAAAKTDVILQAGLQGGDGVADPTVSTIRLECRKR